MVSTSTIEAARTPAGGFTRATLLGWGVPWPPMRPWLHILIARHDANLPGCGCPGKPFDSSVRPLPPTPDPMDQPLF